MITTERRSFTFQNRFRRWFFHGVNDHHKKTSTHHQAPWYKVMCLTGVDYFSTLGYAPGIAFLAANVLSPLATIMLVVLTLFGALPVYMKVAEQSAHGQGSISMLERLMTGWKSKAIVLCLLGFAATDFIITITLSAADAATHIAQNPWAPAFMHDRLFSTLFLLTMLGAVFLMGFREAIGISVLLVASYLVLNAIVVLVSVQHLTADPRHISDWLHTLTIKYDSWWHMLMISVLLFPKLALGMSGFETGVAVMPLVKGSELDDNEHPKQRIANTHKLLLTAAILMSVFLIATSFCTAVLIPEAQFAPTGSANGRALSFLAHEYLGHGFGTAYDISTILILWFAGASAMTGLLNLVPRYLPRYGMAPEWARATRPLVMFLTVVSFVVTIWFKADVDAQGGAYATGVLVLMMSAAFACLITVWNKGLFKRIAFSLIAAVFVYTTVLNCAERPEGLQIAALFVFLISSASLVSRAMRSTELRVQRVLLDPQAREFIDAAKNSFEGQIRILAHRPGGTDYATKEKEARKIHSIQQPEGDFIFLEVALKDASEFIEDCLEVKGEIIDGFPVLKCSSPAIPNAIAAIMLHLRNYTDTTPHAYFGWTEGNPIGYIFKYIFFGEGETAPVTREILRELEANPVRRPIIHVG